MITIPKLKVKTFLQILNEHVEERRANEPKPKSQPIAKEKPPKPPLPSKEEMAELRKFKKAILQQLRTNGTSTKSISEDLLRSFLKDGLTVQEAVQRIRHPGTARQARE